MEITTEKLEQAAKATAKQKVRPNARKFRLFRGYSKGARKLTFVVIFVSVVLVIGAAGMMFYFEPERAANRELERLAREYYEDYLYDNFVENSDLGTAESLVEYTEGGLDKVRLRQLLLYRGEKDRAWKYFENGEYRCNLDFTKVVYYPEAPYGKKDYRIEYERDCKKV